MSIALSSAFESARQKYKPTTIKLLLVAEAPPSADSGRFFYFEDVRTGDSLFLETMKVLYGEDLTATMIRPLKREYLARFRDDGFNLIDASDSPMPKEASSTEKRRLLRAALPTLQRRLASLVNRPTPVILISKTVYEICASPLRAAGFDILNRQMIDFPGSGRQLDFRRKFRQIVRL